MLLCKGIIKVVEVAKKKVFKEYYEPALVSEEEWKRLIYLFGDIVDLQMFLEVEQDNIK